MRSSTRTLFSFLDMLKQSLVSQFSKGLSLILQPVRCNGNRFCIGRMRRRDFALTYPVTLIQPDGSSVDIRYKLPRRILKLPEDLSKLTEAERQRRLEARRPKKKLVVEEDLTDDFDAAEYFHLPGGIYFYTKIRLFEMGNSVKKHVEVASKTGTCTLVNMDLSKIPPEIITGLQKLRSLDVSTNKISKIPDEIGLLVNLRIVNISHNRLTEIPNQFGNFKKLDSLNLNDNAISSLPPSFTQLTALRVLDLSHNRFDVFPVEVCILPKLDALSLGHNFIKVIPDGVRQLQAVELDLNNNRLDSLSEAIIECPRLKVLRVANNILELEAFTPSIMRSSKISLFVVEGNRFNEKQFEKHEGYEQYLERYTKTKIKQEH